MDSVVVACGLSYLMAYGILVPQPGIERTSPALHGRFLTTGPPGKCLFTWNIILLNTNTHISSLYSITFPFLRTLLSSAESFFPVIQSPACKGMFCYFLYVKEKPSWNPQPLSPLFTAPILLFHFPKQNSLG